MSPAARMKKARKGAWSPAARRKRMEKWAAKRAARDISKQALHGIGYSNPPIPPPKGQSVADVNAANIKDATAYLEKAEKLLAAQRRKFSPAEVLVLLALSTLRGEL